jgi:uncharacterized protein (TIRG00374 family)
MPRPEPDRRPREIDLKRSVRLAGLWAACFLLLVLVGVHWLGVEESLAMLGRLGPGLALLILSLSALNYLLRTLRWQLLCRALGVRVPLARNGLYYVAGFAFTVTPGKLGEVVRLWLLRRHHGAAYERTLGLLVVDRITDAVPLLALALLGAGRFAGQGGSVLAMAALVLGGLVLVLRPDWLRFLVKLAYGRLGGMPRLFARALRLLRGLQALVAPKVLAAALALGLAGWSAEVLGAWLVLQALGADVGLIAAAFVFAFGMLVGGLPLFPGGIGGAEGTMIGLLLLLGVDVATAVAATAIIRLATLGFAVALGFLVLPLSLTRPLPARPAAAG